MWDITGWAFATWAKWTLVLAVAVGVAWLALPTGSGGFVIACVVAGVADLFIARQLSREWRHEASLRWWWTR